MNNNIEVEKNILKTMLFILAILGIFYVLILGNMVFNIISRRTLEKEMISLSNEIGKLEVSYLAISSNIDMNLSSTMGFKETKAIFAIRKSLGLNSDSANLRNIKFVNNEI
ncbi:hypothetical protein KKG24_01780 [Patescibacteria group bacterium]|nr:hypothetical protein [Patescibacteria group bacterium]